MLLKSIEGLSKHSSSKKKKNKEIEKSPLTPFILADYHQEPGASTRKKFIEINLLKSN